MATPGHDNDCLTWVDTLTGTAFTGDSIQANGTPTQGIGFYRNLDAYCSSLEKLSAIGLEILVCGHDYAGIGSAVRGRDKVSAVLDYCRDCVTLYDRKIREYLNAGVKAAMEMVALSLKLIGEVGCGMPDSLFLALHTVSEHLKKINNQ